MLLMMTAATSSSSSIIARFFSTTYEDYSWLLFFHRHTRDRMIRRHRPTFTTSELELQLQQVRVLLLSLSLHPKDQPRSHIIHNRKSRSPGSSHKVNTRYGFGAAVPQKLGQLCRRERKGDWGNMSRKLWGLSREQCISPSANDLQSTPGLCLFCFYSSHNPPRDRASKTANWWARWPNGRRRKGAGWKSRLSTLLESTDIFSKQKRALLEQKKVARNMDDAIETLQTCLRLLDLVHRIGEMVREGKYWGALRVCFVCNPWSIHADQYTSHLKTYFISLPRPFHKLPFTHTSSLHFLHSAFLSKMLLQLQQKHGYSMCVKAVRKWADLRWSKWRWERRSGEWSEKRKAGSDWHGSGDRWSLYITNELNVSALCCTL